MAIRWMEEEGRKKRGREERGRGEIQRRGRKKTGKGPGELNREGREETRRSTFLVEERGLEYSVERAGSWPGWRDRGTRDELRWWHRAGVAAYRYGEVLCRLPISCALSVHGVERILQPHRLSTPGSGQVWGSSSPQMLINSTADVISYISHGLPRMFTSCLLGQTYHRIHRYNRRRITRAG